MENKEFTRADGLKVQASQLKEWKSVLKPTVYKALEAAVMAANTKLTGDNGYDVCRGTDLNNWVGNYMCGHRNHKIY